MKIESDVQERFVQGFRLKRQEKLLFVNLYIDENRINCVELKLDQGLILYYTKVVGFEQSEKVQVCCLSLFKVAGNDQELLIKRLFFWNCNGVDAKYIVLELVTIFS